MPFPRYKCRADTPREATTQKKWRETGPKTGGHQPKDWTGAGTCQLRLQEWHVGCLWNSLNAKENEAEVSLESSSTSVDRYTSHESFSRTFSLCAHTTLWLKVSLVRIHSICMSSMMSHVWACVVCSRFVFFLSLSRLYFLSIVHLFSVLHINFHNAGSADHCTHAQRGVLLHGDAQPSHRLWDQALRQLRLLRDFCIDLPGWIRRHRYGAFVLVRCGTRRWDYRKSAIFTTVHSGARTTSELETSLSLSWRKFVASSVPFHTNKNGENRVRTKFKLVVRCFGELSQVCSQIVLKCLHLARIGRPEILWSVNKLARLITKWTKACDKLLSRLISYIHRTSEYKQYCHVGNNAKQCRLGLFQDSDFAGDLEDSKSTSGWNIVHFGSHTFVPISWMCKKKTSVSHSSTESEIISLDAGLRMDGIPALDLWDLIVTVLHGNTNQSKQVRGDPYKSPTRKKIHGKIDDLNNVEFISSNVNSSRREAWLNIFEDNEAVIKMIINGANSCNETCFQNPQSCSWLVIRSNQFGPQKSKSNTLTPKTTRRHIDQGKFHTWWMESSFVFVQHRTSELVKCAANKYGETRIER